MSTFEELLRMTVPVGPGCVAPEGTPMSPDFEIRITEVGDGYVKFYVHAIGYPSDTMNFKACGNTLTRDFGG